MRTALVIAAAGAIALASFGLAQGPRAPAEPGARAPEMQERSLQRQEVNQQHRQEHKQLRQEQRLEQNLEQNLERAEAIATMTRRQQMLRTGECDDPSQADATQTRQQRGPQARW